MRSSNENSSYGSTPVGLTERFDRALHLAHELHRSQERKGGRHVPYISHLLGVCSLVLEEGGDEDQAIAALLHDAAEDQGGRATLEEIRRRFGDRVAMIVDACTDTYEDPKPAWRPRKEAYVARLLGEPGEVLLVSLADKVHNARTILLDVQAGGVGYLDNFAGGRQGTLWYYRALVGAFRSIGWFDSGLIAELDRVTTELERIAQPH
jgi:GTP pyrophosphokinase